MKAGRLLLCALLAMALRPAAGGLPAAPSAPLALSHPARVDRRVLALVNEARTEGRLCGRRFFGPVAPLEGSALLHRIALAHSRDMAGHHYFSHVGRDGSTPGARLTRSGFAWSAVGENIAWGQTTARSVVRAWLASPPHCANIMDRDFTRTGIAYGIDPTRAAGVFWTEDFAAPLAARRR